jgi:hypothetical protein
VEMKEKNSATAKYSLNIKKKVAGKYVSMIDVQERDYKPDVER